MRLLLVVGIALIASSGPIDAQTQPAAQVVGQVVDADSKEPIAGVRVTLSPMPAPRRPPVVPQPPSFAYALTDENGRFMIDVGTAGRHVVSAQKQGYAFDPVEAPTVDVLAGRAASVQIALRRGGAITGRILDDRGAPVSDIRIMAWRRVEGRGGLVPMAGGSGMVSNDLGDFRIAGLPAGEYIVMASAQPMGPFGGGMPASGTTWATTYFPGTTQQSEAQSVTVQQGDSVNGLEFRLIPVAAFVVSGIAVDQAGKPVADAMVTLRPIGNGTPVFAAAPSTRTKPDGTFVIGGVTAGRYVIAANQMMRFSNGVTSFTSMSHPGAPSEQSQISVEGSNVTGVKVVVAAPPQQQ